MKYDPRDNASRSAAAQAMAQAMKKAQFVHLTPRQVNHRCNEVVYGIIVPGAGSIRIYSSIQGGAMRGPGTDAIRVIGYVKTLRHGKWRARKVFERSVYRRGTTGGIVDRTINAARAAWVAVRKEAT